MDTHRTLMRIDIPQVRAADEPLAAVCQRLHDREPHLRRCGERLLGLLLEGENCAFAIVWAVWTIVLAGVRSQVSVDCAEGTQVVGGDGTQADEATGVSMMAG